MYIVSSRFRCSVCLHTVFASETSQRDVNQHLLLLMLMCALNACLSPGAILDAARCLGVKEDEERLPY